MSLYCISLNKSLLVDSEIFGVNILSTSVKSVSVFTPVISFGAIRRPLAIRYHELIELSPRLFPGSHRSASRVLGFTRTVALKLPLVATLTSCTANG